MYVLALNSCRSSIRNFLIAPRIHMWLLNFGKICATLGWHICDVATVACCTDPSATRPPTGPCSAELTTHNNRRKGESWEMNKCLNWHASYLFMDSATWLLISFIINSNRKNCVRGVTCVISTLFFKLQNNWRFLRCTNNIDDSRQQIWPWHYGKGASSEGRSKRIENLTEINNKMRLCSRIYYSNAS